MSLMKKLLLATLSITLFAVSFSSCGDDDDPTRPVISNLEPAEGQLLQIGKVIHFEVNLSDEIGLKGYSIDIHNNFNGHGHKSTGSQVPEGTEPFTYTKSWTTDHTGESLDGRKEAYIHHHDIMIPLETGGKPTSPGNYHFSLYVTNRDGRQTLMFRNVVLTNDEVDDEHE